MTQISRRSLSAAARKGGRLPLSASARAGLALAGAVLACALAAAPAGAAPGDLDRTFAADGRLTMDLDGKSMAFTDVLAQPGGKVITVGSADTDPDPYGHDSDFVLVRFNRDGSLDPSFAGDGIATTDFGASESAVAAALQPDGKVVVAGTSHDGSDDDFVVARYKPHGSLDSSFAGDGKAITDLGGTYDLAEDVAVAPGGEIVIAGTSWDFSTSADRSAFAVARYLPDGSLDPSLAGDGTLTRRVGKYDQGYGAVVIRDGRIVLAGSTQHRGKRSKQDDLTLVRLRPSGKLDRSFSGDGVVRTRFMRGSSVAYALALQRKGRLVAAGSAASGRRGRGRDFALVRYRRNGRLDPSFSGDGRKTTGFGRPDEAARDVAVDRRGKIVAAGLSGLDDGLMDFALARYRADGSLDRRFGSGGRVRTRFGQLAGRYACSLADGVALAEGGIVAAGRVFSCDAADTEDFPFLPAAVARYEG